MLDRCIDQPCEAFRCERSRLLHFLVRERLVKNARRHVRHERNAQHTDAAVCRHNGFRHGGHADRIRSERARHADLRRRFKRWTREHHVDALLHGYADLLCGAKQRFPQRRVVHPALIRKTRAVAVVVFADQRVHARKVDMIGDRHERSRTKRTVHAARRIRHEQRFHAETLHHTHAERKYGCRISLIIMESALHDDDRFARMFADNEPSRMSGYARYGKALDLAVRKTARIIQTVRVSAEPGAEDQSNPTVPARERPQHLRRALDDFGICIHVSILPYLPEEGTALAPLLSG